MSRLRSGIDQPPKAGTLSIQPVGTSSDLPGICSTACTMTASTVPPRMAMSIAPFTLRTKSATSSTSPITKIAIGQPTRLPFTPSCSSGVPGRTMPASARPISAMNRPMPTEMAERSTRGTASKTALRKPVSTRIVIARPSQNTRPMAETQLIRGAMT